MILKYAVIGFLIVLSLAAIAAVCILLYRHFVVHRIADKGKTENPNIKPE